jgi:hypothetical protein
MGIHFRVIYWIALSCAPDLSFALSCESTSVLPLVWARLLYFAPDGKFPSFDVTDSGPWWDRLPAHVETGISFFLKTTVDC